MKRSAITGSWKLGFTPFRSVSIFKNERRIPTNFTLRKKVEICRRLTAACAHNGSTLVVRVSSLAYVISLYFQLKGNSVDFSRPNRAVRQTFWNKSENGAFAETAEANEAARQRYSPGIHSKKTVCNGRLI